MDEGNYLRLVFVADRWDDEDGRLFIYVCNNGFAGQADLYFTKQELADFAVGLTSFPFSVAAVPVVARRSFANADGSCREEITLTVQPYGWNGKIQVTVLLITTSIGEGGELTHTCQTVLVTDHEPLRRFSQAIHSMLRGNVDEAILNTA